VGIIITGAEAVVMATASLTIALYIIHGRVVYVVKSFLEMRSNLTRPWTYNVTHRSVDLGVSLNSRTAGRHDVTDVNMADAVAGR